MMHWYEQWKPEFQRLGHINVGNEGKAQCGLRKGQTEWKEGIRGSVRPEKMNTTYYYQILVRDTVVRQKQPSRHKLKQAQRTKAEFRSKIISSSHWGVASQ